MANLPYKSQSTPLTSFLSGHHPLDVLWNINPEIASIAYAHYEGLLSPEILPAIVGFRECHTQEKIATLRAIVDRLAIDADERKTHVIAQTRERLGELEREAMTAQASMAAGAQVQGQQIKSDGERDVAIIQGTAEVRMQEMRSRTAFEVQKLKYELNRYAIEQNIQGQRYLSDNQIRALYIEAQALKDMIIFVETHRGALKEKELEVRLKEKIVEAETQYLTKLAEAESHRQVQEHRDRAEIIREYLRTQASINRAAIEFEIAKVEGNAIAEQAGYQALSDIAKRAADILKRGAKKVTFNGQTRFGEINFDIEADHGPKPPTA